MDFLEHTAVNDVIVLSVVLDEVKHKNQSVYQRLRTLCASEARRFYVFANEHHKCAAPGGPPRPVAGPALGAAVRGMADRGRCRSSKGCVAGGAGAATELCLQGR